MIYYALMNTTKELLSVVETAKRWNISTRRVRALCADGRIGGAVREGKLWKVPADAPKPIDGRILREFGIPANMLLLIAEVDGLVGKLARQRPLTEGELVRLRDEFLVDYTYASNAIEGNTLTLSETRLVLSGVTVGSRPLRDHLEAVGHRDAFLYLEEVVRRRERISERLVKELHSLVLADRPQDRGAYRRLPVTITGAVHTPPQSYMVAPMMEAWVGDLARTRLHPLVAAAEFHIRFEAIHPFIDGNGRTGRLLANYMLMQRGYLPVSVKYENRRAYYEAFTAYHREGDLRPMLAIFAEAERERLVHYLAAVSGR